MAPSRPRTQRAQSPAIRRSGRWSRLQSSDISSPPFPASTYNMLLVSQFDAIEMLQAAVVGDHHALARREAGENLQLLGIAAPEPDAAATRGLPVGRHHEYPVASGLFQKCAGRNDGGADVLPQSQPSLA